MLLRCDIFQGRSASVDVSMKKVLGLVSVFICVHKVPLYSIHNVDSLVL